ncbi:MAG: hypothetical protein ABSD28_19915 [Tepidisphaeraceae bacterium]|jgi:hypothetical protein
MNQWRQIVSAQPGSGTSIAAYCRGLGISQPSFFAWRRRLCLPQRRLDQSAVAAPPFIEVKAWASAPAAGIEVRLRRGRRLLLRRGFDRGLLMEVVRVLEGIA